VFCAAGNAMIFYRVRESEENGDCVAVSCVVQYRMCGKEGKC
jgi:hypothetical protein